MLYTGYFAKTKQYTEAGLTPVSVAGKTPDFFKYTKWTLFAPRKELFDRWKNNEITDEEYMAEYTEYLESSVTDKNLKKLKEIADKYEIVMCCYEKSSSFCHRHTLAEWLSNKLEIPIGEVEVCYVKNA